MSELSVEETFQAPPLPENPSPPAPLPVRWERGVLQAAPSQPATPFDVSTPSPSALGEGWGEGYIHAYAARINYHGELTPTLGTLRQLHLAHLLTVPFENLDIHLGRPIVLDEELLFDKVVRRRRGGFCYELNGLFAAFLRQIGFAVTLLGAQYPRENGAYAPELDHLVLHVQSVDASKPVLVDVAAGRGSFALPVQTDTRRAQAQPEAGASFRFTPENGGRRLWSREPGGVWQRRYRFGSKPRALLDFNEGCLFHQTSPESHFTQQRICTLLTPDGRITLSEQRLIVTADGARSEQELDDAAYRETLFTRFGIDLDA